MNSVLSLIGATYWAFVVVASILIRWYRDLQTIDNPRHSVPRGFVSVLCAARDGRQQSTFVIVDLGAPPRWSATP